LSSLAAGTQISLTLQDNNFIPRAIDLVTQAIKEDQEKNYVEAYQLYERALEFFVTGLKYEKNERTKETLRKKIAEYMDRAEQLKSVVHKQNGSGSGPEAGKTAVGAGGGKKAALGNDDGDQDKSKLRASLDSSILSEKPNVKWDDVAGLEGAKEALKEAVVLPIRFPALFTGNRKPWKGILLYGPPGTGKSYLAKAVATEVDSTFFSISSSDLVSKWVGESERLVRNLFEMAHENKPSIIFIDEIDALCGSRGDGESDASRRMKNEFLVRMQGAGPASEGVLVLGATNIPWALDPGIRRRFEKRIYIPLPEPHARARVFQIHVGSTPNSLTPDDFMQLATLSDGFSGSDISVCVRDALMEPVRALQSATHFLRAKGKWTPCSPGHPQAQEMTLMDVKPDELLDPEVTMNHFLKVIRNARPTVSKNDLQRYTDFTAEFGQEG